MLVCIHLSWSNWRVYSNLLKWICDPFCHLDTTGTDNWLHAHNVCTWDYPVPEPQLSNAYPKEVKWRIIYYSQRHINTIPESSKDIIRVLSNNTTYSGSGLALACKWNWETLNSARLFVCGLWKSRAALHGKDLQSGHNNNAAFRNWSLDPNCRPFLAPAEPVLLQALLAYVSGTASTWTLRANFTHSSKSLLFFYKPRTRTIKRNAQRQKLLWTVHLNASPCTCKADHIHRKLC